MPDSLRFDADLSAEDESILRRFEAAWRGPGSPDLGRFLPAGAPAGRRRRG